jgi:hypothetical protein
MICLYSKARKYFHLYINPCGWLIVHPSSFFEAAKLIACSYKNKRYMATLPRSGTGYIIPLLTSAVDLGAGGTGEYYFLNDEWIHNINIECPSVLHDLVAVLKDGKTIHKDFFMFAHHPIQKSNVVRVSSMKVVFTVRNIFDQLESWMLHTRRRYGVSEDEFIKRGYVERTISYFNYWGDFISSPNRVPDKDYICIRYEDLILDSLANISRIVTFWGLELSNSSLQTAVNICSQENMISKVPESMLNTNQRITVRDNRGELFSGKNMSYIKRAIRDGLKYDFGYRY